MYCFYKIIHFDLVSTKYVVKKKCDLQFRCKSLLYVDIVKENFNEHINIPHGQPAKVRNVTAGGIKIPTKMPFLYLIKSVSHFNMCEEQTF